MCEAAALRWRRREPDPALLDGSVLVTAVLLAFSVTPLLPFWLTMFGTAIAVLLGKHLFGGLGQNPFNPAMVGYAVLLVLFPTAMTQWPVPLDAAAHSWTDLARLTFAAFTGNLPAASAWDGYTGATALDSIRSGLAQRYTLPELVARHEIVGAVRRARLCVDQRDGVWSAAPGCCSGA